jgi:hypothetical protein
VGISIIIIIIIIMSGALHMFHFRKKTNYIYESPSQITTYLNSLLDEKLSTTYFHIYFLRVLSVSNLFYNQSNKQNGILTLMRSAASLSTLFATINSSFLFGFCSI